MKNKGFTLIELLMVIAIISVLGVVVTINLSQTLEETKEERCNTFVEDIERAACAYVDTFNQDETCTRDNCIIKLKDIIKEGLINDTKNYCTNEDINPNDRVKVSWVNDEKICEYMEK